LLFKVIKYIYFYFIIIFIVGIGYLFYFSDILYNYRLYFYGVLGSKNLEISLFSQIVNICTYLRLDESKYVNTNIFRQNSYIKNNIIFINDEIRSSVLEFKKYLENLHNENLLYKIFNLEQVEYMDFHMLDKEIPLNKTNFIGFIELLLVNLNNLSDNTIWRTQLNFDEKFQIPINKLYSLFFIFHNLFPVLFNYYDSTDDSYLNLLVNDTSELKYKILIYLSMFIVTRFLFLLAIILFLNHYVSLLRTIFDFILSFESSHINYLSKKFKCLNKINNLLINFSNLKTNFNNKKNQDKIYNKEIDNKQNCTLGDYGVKINIYSYYKGKLYIYSITYVSYFIFALLIFLSLISTLENITLLRKATYENQMNLYTGYLISKLG